MRDHRRLHPLPWTIACAFALLACNSGSPEPIASNCDDPDGCNAKAQPLAAIDSVDILLAIDDSGSMAQEAEVLRRQLPRLLNAIVTGGDEESSFPPASSVHVAVVSPDLGVLGVEGIDQCEGPGGDGLLVPASTNGELSCPTNDLRFLAFEGGPAALATVDTVGCVPLVGMDGCGFEQPLEASLKALWPATDETIVFLSDESGTHTRGHGDAENAGFLREDSLLVVVVVTDEDDCSANNSSLFLPETSLDPNSPDGLLEHNLNTRCLLDEDLYPVQRYINGLQALHGHHPDRVVFAAIAGVPPDLVPPQGPALSDIADDDEREAAYDALLANRFMQPTIEDKGTADPGDDSLRPSCNTTSGLAYPPVRLVQTARGFGRQGVLGSICRDDFGGTTGLIVRAIGERLTAAAAAQDAGME